MKLSDALKDVERIVIDSAPIIYYVEQHPTYFRTMDEIIDQIEHGNISGFASNLVLSEVLVQPLKLRDSIMAERYRDVLQKSQNFVLLDPDIFISERAADLRARYSIPLLDAIHLATAIETHCDAFLTNDNIFRRVIEIPILLLDDLEIDTSAKP